MKYRFPTDPPPPFHVYGVVMMKKNICVKPAASTRYCQPGRLRGAARNAASAKTAGK
jgi:hypothetical protein